MRAWHRRSSKHWPSGAPGAQTPFDYLKAIHQPTLVINGDNDVIVYTINSYILQQNIPDAQLILYLDANHGSQLAVPVSGTVCPARLDFLSDGGRVSASRFRINPPDGGEDDQGAMITTNEPGQRGWDVVIADLRIPDRGFPCS